MHTPPDARWMYDLVAGRLHLWPWPLTPDDEGLVAPWQLPADEQIEATPCTAVAIPSHLAAEDLAGVCVCRHVLVRAPDAEAAICTYCRRTWSRHSWPTGGLDSLRCPECTVAAGRHYRAGLTDRRPPPDPDTWRRGLAALAPLIAATPDCICDYQDDARTRIPNPLCPVTHTDS